MAFHKNHIRVWIVLGIIGGIALLAFFTLRATTDREHIVVLGENGFEPQELTVQQGESVTFRTQRKKYFWPASDFHPTHEVYSEFDSKGPVDPDSTWSFQFKNTGEWGYHDHLSPYYTGVISVRL